VALELETTPTNAKARAFYERVGFTLKRNATLRLVVPSGIR
jgi:ribosomal protein S18 acetylase RimI-like enzyme